MNDLLRAQRGRYLWGVTVGDGALLSWQVGDPHLHVATVHRPDGLPQRVVEPRGRWQVAILDGEVTLTTPAGSVALSGSEAPRDGEALALLEGQALVTFEASDRLTLRFDLESELVVAGPHALVVVAGPEGEAQWSSAA